MIFRNIDGKKLKIYFIGIGGVSMSALAKYLIYDGYEVSGSDRVRSKLTNDLESLGCKINIGHDKRNIINQDIVVYNSAISADNEELKQAQDNKMCLLSRIELLQMIANGFNKVIGICGTHGKTTTTAMVAHILLKSKLGFTSHIGGEDNVLGNLYQNGKEIFLTEVCEYNKNIRFFNSDIAVALNIDNDHMNCYNDFADLKDTFYEYLNKASIPIVNIDDKSLFEYSKNNQKAITFGVKNKSADYSVNVIKCKNSSKILKFYEKDNEIFEFESHLFGDYNVVNYLCAVAVGKTLRIPNELIIDGLKSFLGVKRRNEYIGNLFGCDIFADYAHHPKEIECALKSFTDAYKHLTVIFQPHTYSRTKLLFKDFLRVFNGVENLYLYKTYPARELQSQGYSAKFLADNLTNAKYFEDFNELLNALKDTSKNGSKILVLGAGDLYDKFKIFANCKI